MGKIIFRQSRNFKGVLNFSTEFRKIADLRSSLKSMQQYFEFCQFYHRPSKRVGTNQSHRLLGRLQTGTFLSLTEARDKSSGQAALKWRSYHDCEPLIVFSHSSTFCQLFLKMDPPRPLFRLFWSFRTENFRS